MTGNPLTELTLEQLRTRTSRKWRTYPADVLPLWIAEMDVDLAPPIVDALTTALTHGDTGYPAGEDYADAYRGFAKRTWGWDVDLAATASMPDVMRGMTALLGLVTAPGDALVITTPVYPPFVAFARNAGRRVVEAPLHPDGRVNLTSLEIAFQNETRDGRRAALLLSNPHNPTGTVHTAAELTAVAGLANQYSVRVISDEIHAPLVLPGATFTPYLTVPGGQTGFSLVSASKGWNLSGIKAALAVAGTTAIDDLTRLPQETRLGASHLGTSPTRRPSVTAANGSTRSSPGSIRTDTCCGSSSASSSPRSPTANPKRPSSPGSTAVHCSRDFRARRPVPSSSGRRASPSTTEPVSEAVATASFD